ncbi:MAG: class II glutamine amidotransferase [Rhodobacteraceae bacterium]|nr:class II glutamine amidotransferase [Paracoccaceae bacterium]
MCRWAAWVGEESFLESVVSMPEQSLIAQSKNALECKTNINADGFGVAWYDQRSEPGLYKNVLPAWSDPNLSHLVQQVKSRLYLAHVRASTGTATSYNNCHPFTAKNWSFMHNGQFGGFDGFRKAADMLVPEALYPLRRGATDSELLFLLALSFGLDQAPVAAVAKAVGCLHELAAERGCAPHVRLAACWSDGKTIYAARYASDRYAPTIYWRQTDAGVLLVSEPLDSIAADWTVLKAGSCLIASETSAEIRDFSPSLSRIAA